MSIEQTGVADEAMIKEKFPSPERLRQGRVAVMECYQCIPCNPCESACPNKAISIGADITNIPVLDPDKCTGCGLCVSRCPGLAIMLAALKAEGQAELTLPYEFLPLPAVGDRVTALDREGSPVCPAVVKAVLSPASCDRTPRVRIVFDEAFLYKVRHFSQEAAL